MEVKEALLKRRSIRKFEDTPVKEEDILELLHAGMSGPSAVNKRPWEFYVVTNKEKLLELKKSSPFSKIEAPLAIIVCGNLLRTLPLKLADYWIQDCSASTENILLRATDLGLGAVWCGAHPQKGAVKAIRKVLNVPIHHLPLNIIYIGYPKEEREARDQYDEERVTFIR
jgi:nitroreductase